MQRLVAYGLFNASAKLFRLTRDGHLPHVQTLKIQTNARGMINEYVHFCRRNMLLAGMAISFVFLNSCIFYVRDVNIRRNCNENSPFHI